MFVQCTVADSSASSRLAKYPRLSSIKSDQRPWIDATVGKSSGERIVLGDCSCQRANHNTSAPRIWTNVRCKDPKPGKTFLVTAPRSGIRRTQAGVDPPTLHTHTMKPVVLSCAYCSWMGFTRKRYQQGCQSMPRSALTRGLSVLCMSFDF